MDKLIEVFVPCKIGVYDGVFFQYANAQNCYVVAVRHEELPDTAHTFGKKHAAFQRLHEHLCHRLGSHQAGDDAFYALMWKLTQYAMEGGSSTTNIQALAKSLKKK